MNRLLRWFAHDHLPAPLQGVSALCADLAEQVDTLLADITNEDL